MGFALSFMGQAGRSNIALAAGGLAALGLIVSCGPITPNQKADALAAEYANINKTSDRCRFSQKVLDAYSGAGNGAKVQEWEHRKKIDCLIVNTERSVGDYSN